jgi:hypothetical protein
MTHRGRKKGRLTVNSSGFAAFDIRQAHSQNRSDDRRFGLSGRERRPSVSDFRCAGDDPADAFVEATGSHETSLSGDGVAV